MPITVTIEAKDASHLLEQVRELYGPPADAQQPPPERKEKSLNDFSFQEILDFLNGFIEEKGYAPTIEEIAGHFSLRSLATVHKHLSNLQKKGFPVALL